MSKGLGPILLLGGAAAFYFLGKKKKGETFHPPPPLRSTTYHGVPIQLTEGGRGWDYSIQFMQGQSESTHNSELTHDQAMAEAKSRVDEWGDPGIKFYPEAAEFHIYWMEDQQLWGYEVRVDEQSIASGTGSTPTEAFNRAEIALSTYWNLGG